MDDYLKIKELLLDGYFENLIKNEDNYRTPKSIINSISIIFHGYEMEKEGNTSALEELKTIINKIGYINNFHLHSAYNMIDTEDDYRTLINQIDYLLEYNGIWDINFFLQKNHLNRDNLIAKKQEILQEAYPTQKDLEAKRNIEIKKSKEEKEKQYNDYYRKKVIYSNKDIKKYLSPSSFINKESVNIDLIEYPILLKLYKDNQLCSIKKVKGDLRGTLHKYNLSKGYDDFSIVNIPSKIFDDLHVEALIMYRPLYMSTYITPPSSANYRSIEQIRKRFSGELGVSFIRKIVDKYNVPSYKFDNGAEIVHRDLLDKSIHQYYEDEKK